MHWTPNGNAGVGMTASETNLPIIIRSKRCKTRDAPPPLFLSLSSLLLSPFSSFNFPLSERKGGRHLPHINVHICTYPCRSPSELHLSLSFRASPSTGLTGILLFKQQMPCVLEKEKVE